MQNSKYVPIVEACIIGAVAGISALVLGEGIRALGSLRIYISEAKLPLEVLPAFGFLGGLIAGLVLIVAPETSGSGIPQVRAVLNRMRMPLDFRIALIKLVGGTIALGSGLFLGREGPTVQVGAAVASQLTHWMPTTRQHRRYLIAAGAGAGLAAAFSAPIAGVIFVVEELLKGYKASAVSLAIIACFSASLVEKLFGAPLHLHSESKLPPINFNSESVLFLLVLGVVCGLYGTLFNRGVLLSLKLYGKFKFPKPFKVALAGGITGILIALLPSAIHNYAATRTLISTGSLEPQLVPILFAVFSLLTLLAYGSGAPGGLFAPALTIGSTIGVMVGNANDYYLHSNTTELFALVGMGAFFSAVARAPLTAIVIIFEMFSDLALVIPLMLGCVVSSTVADTFYKGGLYDLLMVWNGIHLRAPDAEAAAQPIYKASDLMHEDFTVVDKDTSVEQALNLLAQLQQKSLPVVQEAKLVGIFSPRNQLESIQKTKGLTVESIMFRHPLSVGPNEHLEELLTLFVQHQFSWVPVTTGEKLIGILYRDEVLSTLFHESGGDSLSREFEALSEESELEGASDTGKR